MPRAALASGSQRLGYKSPSCEIHQRNSLRHAPISDSSDRPLVTPEWELCPDGVDELVEETGIKVLEADLIPFGCLSEAEAHTIHYPNGDVTHCFALLFLATAWQGDASPNEEETTDAKFIDLTTPPEPLHAPTGHALELLRSYLKTGAFQLR